MDNARNEQGSAFGWTSGKKSNRPQRLPLSWRLLTWLSRHVS